MIVRRLYGSIGAAWGALLPAFALLLFIPPLFCAGPWCPSFNGSVTGFNPGMPGGRMVVMSVAWSPYLDNRDEGAAGSRDDRVCRGEGTPPPPPLRLSRYAFPASFDPAAFPSQALYACILARSDGTILAVRLPQAIQSRAADRELAATIRRGWRFEGAGGDGMGWERVRLNEGPLIEGPLVY